METCRSNAVRRRVLSLHRNGNRFDWAPPAILFVYLVFTLTAPTYIWTIIGA